MEKNRVEFVDYTGKYPNLCDGVLTVKIDGEVVKFGHNYGSLNIEGGNTVFLDEIGHPNEDAFWESGGIAEWDIATRHERIDIAPWKMDIEKLEQKYWEVADELLKVFNENVQHGCCSGCVDY